MAAGKSEAFEAAPVFASLLNGNIAAQFLYGLVCHFGFEAETLSFRLA